MEIDPGLAILIVAVTGVVVVLGLLVAVIVWIRRSPGTTISAGHLGELIIMIDSQTQENTASHVVEASTARRQRRTALPLPSSVRFGRVLWIDDNPDGSVRESMALETLGISVTKTMHPDIALSYLSGLDYVAVIAGVREDSNPEAVGAFFEAVRKIRPAIISLGYLAAGSSFPPQIAGVTIVGDPADLVSAVVTELAPGT
ncbi:hypothetical protein [Microbacterium sp. NPDC076895]|uniref:hypothetical protein n=1 Tax=Microbacterium sp. NPDC076895 TaxID=3154957 RepID=UPI003420C37C